MPQAESRHRLALLLIWVIAALLPGLGAYWLYGWAQKILGAYLSSFESGITAPMTAPVALTPVLTTVAATVTTASATATTAQPWQASMVTTTPTLTIPSTTRIIQTLQLICPRLSGLAATYFTAA